MMLSLIFPLSALAGVSSGGGGVPFPQGPRSEPVDIQVGSVQLVKALPARGADGLITLPSGCTVTVGPVPIAPGAIVNVGGISLMGGPHPPMPCDPPPHGPACPPQFPGSDPLKLRVELEDTALEGVTCPVAEAEHPNRDWLAQRLAPYFLLRDESRPMSPGVAVIPGFSEPLQLVTHGDSVFAVHSLETSPRSAELRVIHSGTNFVVATWKLPQRADQIAIDGNEIYALDGEGAMLYAAPLGSSLDESVWRAIALPKGDPKLYQGRVFAVHAGRAYVSLYSQERIDVIDLARGMAVGTIKDLSCNPTLLTVTEDLLLATSVARGNDCGPGVAAFGLSDLRQRYRASLPQQPIATVRNGRELIVGELEQSDLLVLDIATGKELRKLPVPGAGAMAVHGDTLVVGDQNGQVRSYAVATGAPCESAFVLANPHRTWPALQSIVFAPDSAAYVTNYNDGAVDVVPNLLCR